MSGNWEDDKSWSDGLMGEVKKILATHLIRIGNRDEDRSENTDLVVFKSDAGHRIACRIRRNFYFRNPRYREEFTMRRSRPYGNKTELAKVLEGWGDYFFYGFASEDGKALAGWSLLDLAVFRKWWNEYPATHGGEHPGTCLPNQDGSSDFVVYSLSDFPVEGVLGRWPEKKDVAAIAKATGNPDDNVLDLFE